MYPSVEQLSAFVNAAEQGSFSAAARKLGKAQSVVSTLVTNLELDLGLELFSREGRYPKLTLHGKALLAQAKLILSQCQRFSTNAQSYSLGVEPELQIAVDALIDPQLICQALQKIEKQFPAIQIKLITASTDDIPALIQNKQAQLGIMLQSLSLPDFFDFKLLGNIEVCGVVAPSHPIASLESVSFNQLTQYRQILISALSPENAEESKQWQVSTDLWTTNNLSAAVEFTRQGLGWSLLPISAIAPYLQNNQLKQINLDFDPNQYRPLIDLIWPTGKPQGPVATQLQTLLASVF